MAIRITQAVGDSDNPNGYRMFVDENGNSYNIGNLTDYLNGNYSSYTLPGPSLKDPSAIFFPDDAGGGTYKVFRDGNWVDAETYKPNPHTKQDLYDAIVDYYKGGGNDTINQVSLSGDSGFGGFMNNLHSGAVSGIGSAISAAQPVVSGIVENTFASPTVSDAVEAISPLIPAATMATIGAITGGAGLAAGLSASAAGAIGGTTAAIPSAIQQESVLPLAIGAAGGAIGGGLLGGSTPDYGIDGYLSPEEYFADVNQYVPTASDLPVGMNLSGEPTGYSAPQQLQTINPDYVAASNAGQTNKPVIYGSQGMLDAGQQLGLTPEQTLSLSDTSLGGVSANELAWNTAATANNASDIANRAVNKTIQQFSKGLLSQGANVKMPTFDINFTPLSAQTWGATGNNWLGDATQQAVEAAATAPQNGEFKGSFLMGKDRDKDLTKYLAEYLPLNASKKLKGLSSYLA